MPSMQEIRQKYPQYDDMSDQEFADKFHDKFYSDMPKEEFYKKLSFSPKIEEKKQPESLLQKSGRYARQYINEPLEDLGREALNVGAGAGQGLANTGVGVRNLLAKGANLLPGVNIPMEKAIDIAPRNINTSFGDLLGMLAGGGLVSRGTSAVASHIQDIPQIANHLKRASDIIGKSPIAIQKSLGALKPASKNALVGAAVAPEDQGFGAALGAGGSLLGSSASKVIPKLTNKLGIGGQPGEETIKGLTYEKVKPSVEAAERLGTPLRPSEASGNPFVGMLEGRYPRTREAAFENVELGTERLGKEKKSINKLLNTIYGKGSSNDNELAKMYESVSRWNIKPEIVNQLNKDPLISKAIESVKSDPAWQRNLGNVPENNLAFLDKVKRSLGDHEETLKRSGEKSRAREYGSARKNLTKVLDESVPGYKKTRNLAERKIAREKIENKLKKSEVSGSEFFKKIIENDKEFNKTLKSVRNVPEAKQQLQDMKAAWHSLINVEKPGTASYQSEKAINQARGSLQKSLEIWQNLTGKKKNVEAVKFIRGDEWVKRLKSAHKSGNKKEIENAASDIMGKLFPSGFETIKEGVEE